MATDTLQRPVSAPERGVVDAYDAGWDAHSVGLGRKTVEFLSMPDARPWALLGYDVRAKVASLQGVQNGD